MGTLHLSILISDASRKQEFFAKDVCKVVMATFFSHLIPHRERKKCQKEQSVPTDI